MKKTIAWICLLVYVLLMASACKADDDSFEVASPLTNEESGSLQGAEPGGGGTGPVAAEEGDETVTHSGTQNQQQTNNGQKTENGSKKDSEPQPGVPAGVETETVPDFSDYVIIYSDKASSYVLGAISDLNASFAALLGNKLRTSADFLAADSGGLEIIVGATSRSFSADAAKKISGFSWIIQKVGSRVVINGTTEAMLIEALKWFRRNCVETASGKGIKVPEEYTVAYKDMISLAAAGKKLRVCGNYVYFEVIEMQFPGAISEDIPKTLSESGVVVIGDDGSAAYKEKRDSLGYGEYAIFASNRRLYLCGKSEEAIMEGCKGLNTVLRTWEEANGTVQIPAEYNDITVYNKQMNLIPVVDTAQEIDSSDTGHGCVQIVTYEQSEGDYRHYLSALTAKGYKKYAENTLEGNLFTTYTDSDTILTAYYIAYCKQVRVISEPRDGRVIGYPQSDNKAYKKICSPLLVQVGADYTAAQIKAHEEIGMCYIFRLEDGSFIIVDGGYRENYERIYKTLKKLSPNKEIVIAAWIITHRHIDHVGAFYDFSLEYASDVKLENFIWHYESEAQGEGAGGWKSNMNDTLDAVNRFEGVKTHIAHPGEVYYIRNAKITMLFAMDLFEPRKLSEYGDNTNVASLVFTVEQGGKKILITGDHALERIFSDNVLMKTYSEKTLKSDFVQMIHHGLGGGATNEFYQVVNADYTLWPIGWGKLLFHKLDEQARNQYVQKHGTLFVADDDMAVFNFGSNLTYKVYVTLAAFLNS